MNLARGASTLAKIDDERPIQMLDPHTAALLRVLVYPIQFARNPVDHVERVIHDVTPHAGVQAPPEDYILVISRALQSSDGLSKLIPQPHSELVIRDYLVAVQRFLLRGSVLRCGTCGADWAMGQFGAACAECAGGALEIACPHCGGQCGAKWRRAVLDSIEMGIGHWTVRVNLRERWTTRFKDID